MCAISPPNFKPASYSIVKYVRIPSRNLTIFFLGGGGMLKFKDWEFKIFFVEWELFYSVGLNKNFYWFLGLWLMKKNEAENLVSGSL